MNAPPSPLAQRLVDLRQGRPCPAGFEAAPAPTDAAAAMAVQAEVTHALHERIGGWKVGIGPDGVPFATAVNTAVEAVDKLRDTAESHQRMFLVEVMGRASGYIALYTAIAAGAASVLGGADLVP